LCFFLQSYLSCTKHDWAGITVELKVVTSSISAITKGFFCKFREVKIYRVGSTYLKWEIYGDCSTGQAIKHTITILIRWWRASQYKQNLCKAIFNIYLSMYDSSRRINTIYSRFSWNGTIVHNYDSPAIASKNFLLWNHL